MDKKIHALLNRREKAKAALYKAQLEGNETMRNIGWGHAMRRVKLPKFAKEDRAKERLQNINNQLKNLGYSE